MAWQGQPDIFIPTSSNKAVYNIWFITHLALPKSMLTLDPKSVILLSKKGKKTVSKMRAMAWATMVALFRPTPTSHTADR
jgi:hypothetical protein